MADLPAFIRRLIPNLPPVAYAERLRASVGALVGIVLTGFLTQLALGPSANLPLLIAPMGASSVLLFAVPASPLAQPWAVLGGNTVAALVGVTAAQLIADPYLAAAVAGSVAILAMLSLRCLHPPSGAVALTAVLGGPAVLDAGYGFVLWPVGVNTLLLLVAAFVFNNLTGRSYPHALEGAQAARPVTGDKPPTRRIGLTREDVEAALRDYPDLLAVDPVDVEAVLHDAEYRALRRRAGKIRCADIMTRNVRAVAPGDTIAQAIEILRRNHIKVLPVTDEDARVVGILTQTDLVMKGLSQDGRPRLALAHRLKQTARLGRAPQALVEDIMTSPVRTARPEMSIVDLLPLMADGGLHHLPVVGDGNRLLGIITQSDVIGALMTDSAGAYRYATGEHADVGTRIAV